jgi:hypothetical protein
MDLSDLSNKVISLDQTRVKLESSYSDIEVWLAIFTAVVILGLAIEYRRDFLKLFQKPIDWGHALEMFGAFLVVVGICGELGTEYFAGDLTTKLDSNGRQVERLLFGAASEDATKIASDEKQIAADNRAAQTATAQAANLGVKVDTLPRFVSGKEAEVKALAADIDRRNADLSNVLKDAQASEQRTADLWAAVQKNEGARVLSAEQTSKLISGVKGKVSSVIVRAYTSDPESMMYATDFINAFSSHGIKATFDPFGLFNWWVPSRDSTSAVLIFAGAKQLGPAETALADALKSASIPFGTTWSEEAGNAPKVNLTSETSIIVLPRPPVQTAPVSPKQ